MASGKKKKKKATPKKKDELLLELDGKVYIVQKKNGKEASREELPGDVVLGCILDVLKKSLNEIEKYKDVSKTAKENSEFWTDYFRSP